MNPPLLYTASVPVFQRYLRQLGLMLDAAQAELTAGRLSEAQLLEARLAPDMLPLRLQVEIAAGFVLRACAPLQGQAVPPLGTPDPGLAGLQALLQERLSYLDSLVAESFREAELRQISSDAGQAQLQLPATEFLQHLALPNFFFHLTCTYALLRQLGVPLGKQDFDGLHRYR
ncbi:DUF1993 family protein [Paucibacter sp. DJ2R-2]|uniref:DUF1993 domain-containing protein n=1 Tax=Paucibacter sp. DJ2R-2 TaxID=2893558 RepID=UPI0021E42342|nr:DUF1993 domain-containing protein [Paucibacter sp. DJ2R-2]MCV2422079.1 DUF1993 domain-containing protein [Paucibacter sp. DJ4R-1]MCV2440337.1 DUF1993 domain-containing protein [Paucibacter sp. DJ2R-2]